MVKEKSFYRTLAALMLPLALQNMLSFCVQMLDTIMVGALGDVAVSAVSFANQPYFIFQTFMFGLSSGGSVLISQYWGKKDTQSIRKVMGLMMQLTLVLSAVYSLFCFCLPQTIMRIFSSNMAILEIGEQYLRVVVTAYVMNGIANCYLSALQAKENVRISTTVYLLSFFVNMFFNYVFIFGKFGFPRLGVVGAAVGTIIARGFEMAACLVYAGFFEKDIRFGWKDMGRIERKILPSYLKISLPVIGNDLVWSLGTSAQMAVIGHISTSFATAANIAGIAQQLALITIYGIARASSIMMGTKIGTGDLEYAKKMGRTFLVLSMGVGILACGLVLTVRGPLLLLYPNITWESRELAYQIMGVIAIIMLASGVENMTIIGILRGSGDARFAFLTDAGCMWLIGFPLGLLAAFVWKLPVLWVYFFLRGDVFVKITICALRVLRGNYIKDVTRN